jgi:hypothetical protein
MDFLQHHARGEGDENISDSTKVGCDPCSWSGNLLMQGRIGGLGHLDHHVISTTLPGKLQRGLQYQIYSLGEGVCSLQVFLLEYQSPSLYGA